MAPNDIKFITKRNGIQAPFNQSLITNAILKAGRATGEFNADKAEIISNDVIVKIKEVFRGKEDQIRVEDVQDIVEITLMRDGMVNTAKAYIIYRQERSKIRDKEKLIPQNVKELVAKSKKYFRNPLSEFIYYRTYSRWIDGEERRETWIETIDRYINFMRENIGAKLTEEEYAEIRNAILKQESMPSMRLLWGAGEAARKTNICAYNCSFIAPSKLEDFAEIMYILMCGAGVGFSVESQNIQELPIINRQIGDKLPTHIIEDSKEGWGNALTLGIKTWYEGKDINFDYGKLRPSGARLKTMGGQSSGPDPLRSLMSFTKETILSRQGKRLRNIDAHDIICKIGEIVVAGGVRRSALISLSELDDKEMRDAKVGQFYLTHPHRSLANNSVAYNQKPDNVEFMQEWLSLAKAKTGERGIFNRAGLKTQLPARRWRVFEPHLSRSGVNPCGEIVLRSKQFCNLSEVVARENDTEESLLRKTRIATILGTYQSTLTNFPYLSPEWKKNCDEERLLGVSVTGQWDSKAVHNKETLQKMRDLAIKTNKEYAVRFGINASTCITCVKPSGTVSQLVDAASGMHPRHAPFYIRRVRIAASDPLFKMLKDQKYPHHPEVGQNHEDATTFVLDFPVKAPKSDAYKDSLSAIDQLEHWKLVKENYTEHNPSVTISVSDDEWVKVANWIYENWDIIGGLSFLPRSDHAYRLAPYEEITEDRYNEILASLPEIDFSQIITYEREDNTVGAKELACSGGVCEVDIAVADEAAEKAGLK
ncbi:MAG: ribonucleoside-triphosphate reductase [Candidatus Liptonbacteria bacterium CG11_big_fil_rev_8_21_14_0_20_35_14]|uniref:Ribonucleoside-triphosphate reductase n=1 Tax=Candidatus Liptonbacteria bacterium CG11_big_fil_rev_8_21_14_0_20_35_14 TaxID=1974634 RepID=A0A2H0N7W7_9BACT|nr:MAG: ribonucleoside-triphosphate reductase [Candidatus Liptonbacteria bacterium CG11_big_fil_rev_8_21_14_0_20_35_14]